MYLKRMELQGFKSFSNKTLFEFAPGITAIVGPNGSGKSNVAESIRWVLGEQSSRNMRARRLEDVIFSGSSQRAAVGMAEVSITLDNESGWLPLDYSEVVVSRRAYRSGDSEYLINKNKVRLRDVLDLFLRAQVGQNSYAFMGQGLVEEVLVMRPEERRRLLEEAADVRLLRTRLDEARDRLSATRENLERVNLLLEEIGPRLKQLERQASRAGEHSRLASELAETMRELFRKQWNDAQSALVGARAALDQRQQALAAAREEAKNCEEGLVALTAHLEEREKEVADRRAKHRAAADRVHELSQRLTFDRERVEGQTRRRGELQAEVQTLREERVELQGVVAQAQERARGILPEIEDARSLISTRRQELNTLEQEQAGLRRRVAEGEEQLERAQRGLKDSETALARLADEETRSQGETVRRANKRRELVAALTEVGRDFRELGRRILVIEDEVADTESERQGLAAMVESGRTSVNALETEAHQMDVRLGQLRAREELLRRLQAGAEGIDTGARFLLGEDDDDRVGMVEGLVGLVRDIVRVPPGLEAAVEAALAENIQGLVFENMATAIAAIEMLSSRKAGRALIYPLDALRSVPALNIMREKGVIGVAARLVRCESRFRPLVDALLGHVIIVENVTLARDVLRRGLGSVVTMDGVLLRPNGALSGGIAKAAAESFERIRELDDLPEQIHAAEARARDIDLRLRRERETLNGAVAALGQIEPALQAKRDERARRQNALLENRGRLIMQRSEARSLWSELRRGDDVTDWRANRRRIQADKERFEAAVKEATEALKRDREALGLVSPRRNSSIDAVSEAAAAHANLEGEARSLTRELERLQVSLARTEESLRAREATLQAIEAELKTIGERGDTSSSGLDAAREDLAALTAEMEPAEGELSHLSNRQRSLSDQLTRARAALLEAERMHLEAESAVKLHADEIDALREHMSGEGFYPEGDDVIFSGSAAPTGQRAAGNLPPVRGGADVDVDTLRARVAHLRQQIRSLGLVNEQAPIDYNESKERFDFLSTQVDDLTGSEQTLLSAIDELESNIRERLKETFVVVDAAFQRYFEAFFAGGKAHLNPTMPEDYANTGIEIIAQPPGKRVNTLAMLSGGERALTSLALLLALLEAHPSPICVLDEVDAALDETNVGRFVDALRALESKTQFIIITHNPRTVEAADSIYGVSMGADNTSRILSLRLDDLRNN
ncbi:MAG TPA: chromosome segregation protein SMC [Dehalococcoidia bacterium]|nr:chromosome segregation protein SMC [Dehalococcoidia bacterium]